VASRKLTTASPPTKKLIKVKLHGIERGGPRGALLREILRPTSDMARSYTHIGNILVLWRGEARGRRSSSAEARAANEKRFRQSADQENRPSPLSNVAPQDYSYLTSRIRIRACPPDLHLGDIARYFADQGTGDGGIQGISLHCPWKIGLVVAAI